MEPEHEDTDVGSAEYPVSLHASEREGGPAGVAASGHGERNSESMTATEGAPGEGAPGEEAPSEEAPGEEAPGEGASGKEPPGEEPPGEEAPGERASGKEPPGEEPPGDEAAASEPEDSRGSELPGVDNLPTSEGVDVKMDEQPEPCGESVVFELSYNNDDDDDDGPPRLHRETPERETTGPAEDEEAEAAEEEPSAAPADTEDVRYEEWLQLLRELSEGTEKARQHSSQLHMKLAEYFRKKAGDDGQLGRDVPVSEQLHEYEKFIKFLSELKQQMAADSEAAQQQAEELSRQCREKMDKVEHEWRALVALKQDVAVTALSRRLGKPAAQAKVESALAAEQRRQDELIKLRLKHIKLKTRIHRLEAELRDGEGHARDPLQLQFEQLQAERHELKKLIERQNEDSLKMQKKISGCLELLSHVKEKLCWSLMEVQAKREQLAEVEAALARKRDLLTRTKQARNRLQRDNLRLKECRGLLGNRALLQDFEDTVDASDRLEEQLENLKGRRAEIVFSCGRRAK